MKTTGNKPVVSFLPATRADTTGAILVFLLDGVVDSRHSV